MLNQQQFAQGCNAIGCLSIGAALCRNYESKQMIAMLGIVVTSALMGKIC